MHDGAAHPASWVTGARAARTRTSVHPVTPGELGQQKKGPPTQQAGKQPTPPRRESPAVTPDKRERFWREPPAVSPDRQDRCQRPGGLR